jgi:pSer/pThr/pTyr-binding forkhead associated (FHA) protein
MSFLLVKVGRSTVNDIQINDERINEKHLEIFRDVEGNVYLTDLNSEQGTFVNDVKITEAVQLFDNDTVKIANIFLFDWKGVLAKADSTSFSIGTAPSNKIRLTDSQIDPFHVQLYKDFKGNVFVNDLKSLYGTFINGHKIQGVALIQKGDRLKLGSNQYNWEDLFLIGRLTKIQDEKPTTSSVEKIEVPKVSSPEKPRTQSSSTPKNDFQHSNEIKRNAQPDDFETQESAKMNKWVKVGIIIAIDIVLLIWLSFIL